MSWLKLTVGRQVYFLNALLTLYFVILFRPSVPVLPLWLLESQTFCLSLRKTVGVDLYEFSSGTPPTTTTNSKVKKGRKSPFLLTAINWLEFWQGWKHGIWNKIASSLQSSIQIFINSSSELPIPCHNIWYNIDLFYVLDIWCYFNQIHEKDWCGKKSSNM